MLLSDKRQMVKIGHAHKAPVKSYIFILSQWVLVLVTFASATISYVCLMMKIKVIWKCSLEYCTSSRNEIPEMNWNEKKRKEQNRKGWSETTTTTPTAFSLVRDLTNTTDFVVRVRAYTSECLQAFGSYLALASLSYILFHIVLSAEKGKTIFNTLAC